MSPNIISTVSQLVIAAIWVLSLSPNFCTAWSIAPDCADFSDVSAAMTEALNMAIYAGLRAADDLPRLGTSMVDLLGAPNENDPANLKLVQIWFTNVIGAATVPSPDGIVIHCSDNHLTLSDLAKREYIDTERGNTMVSAPIRAGTAPTDNACGGFISAFTYAAGVQQVILLCSDGARSALKSSTVDSLGRWRTSGNLKEAPPVKAKGLDTLGVELSTVILHELMHAAASAEQLKKPQLSQFPAILPDKVNGEDVYEIYQYTPISGKKLGDKTSSGQSTANNLQHNADSFALLAASWYLPCYAWVNGECKTISPARQAPVVYPNTPIPPEPS